MSIASSSYRSRKSSKRGVLFTIMICGASGTGRTTFMNMLCGKNVIEHKQFDDPANAHIEEQVQIKPITTEIENEGLRIALTIVDTPGFGDLIDNSNTQQSTNYNINRFSKVLSYIEKQYDDILAEESRIKRNPRFKDNRVHCLLYFIEPTGHGLRDIDITLMSKLATRVNVIPMLAKADTLTQAELLINKKLIMEDIAHYDIPIYNFPYDIESDDDDTIELNAELRGLLPFAVVGSEDVLEIDGKLIRARRYPWGTVDIENPEHSDYLAIKSALLNTHLSDLKEITHDYLYENYRTEKLSRVVEGLDGGSNVAAAENGSRVKEELIRREEERLREIERKVQKEISEKRQQLMMKEERLQNLESGDDINSSAPSTPAPASAQSPSSIIPDMTSSPTSVNA